MARELTAWLCWFEGDDLPVTILADSEESAAETFCEVRGAGVVRVASATIQHAAPRALADLMATWIPIRVVARATFRYHGARL